jgi:hypothetical protein
MKEEGWMGTSRLLRTGDFQQEDVVADKFMRSSVVRENNDPLRCAKLCCYKFLAAVLRRGLRREARAPGARSIAIEDEDGTAFEGDLDLGGLGALVEQVETRFPIVGRNPFAEEFRTDPMPSALANTAAKRMRLPATNAKSPK